MLMNGPVTTEFKCGDDFQVYREGLMVQDHPIPEKDNTQPVLRTAEKSKEELAQEQKEK